MLGFFFPGAEVDESRLPGPPLGTEPPDAELGAWEIFRVAAGAFAPFHPSAP